MSMTIHFDGLSEWDAAVDRLIERTSAASKEVVSKGAELINKNAAERAPVRRGTLRRSIRRTKLAPFTATSWMAECGPTVIYGRRVALGFGPGGSLGIDSLGRHYHQKGNNFWERGLSDSEAELRTLYIETYSAALEE